MKLKILSLLFFIGMFTASAFAQSETCTFTGSTFTNFNGYSCPPVCNVSGRNTAYSVPPICGIRLLLVSCGPASISLQFNTRWGTAK